MTSTKTMDFDVTEIAEQVSRICDRFDPEIRSFYGALATLYKEDDLTGIDVMLKVVTGMLLTLIGQEQAENMKWFSDHIKGNC